MYTSWKRDSKRALRRLKKPAKRLGKAAKRRFNPFDMFLPLTWLLACTTYALACIAVFSLRKLFSWGWHKITTP